MNTNIVTNFDYSLWSATNEG